MRTTRENQVQELLLQQYERYYRLAYSYVRNEQDALDIVQESAYRAMRDCRQVRNDTYLSTWIYRIVINTALEFLRKHKREALVEEVIEPFQTKQEFEDTLSLLHSRWELTDILEHLPAKDKTVILLRFFEDCKLEDIAQITGENINTVKARLYRTLRKLRLEVPKT